MSVFRFSYIGIADQRTSSRENGYCWRSLFRVWRILRHRNRNRSCSPRIWRTGKPSVVREGIVKHRATCLSRYNPRSSSLTLSKRKYSRRSILCIKISLFYYKDSIVKDKATFVSFLSLFFTVSQNLKVKSLFHFSRLISWKIIFKIQFMKIYRIN